MIEAEKSPLTASEGMNQCRQFLMGLAPKGDSREIWVKFGNESFYRATWDEAGNLSGTETRLTVKTDPTSRADKGKPIPDLLRRLSDRSHKEEGGVFFVPAQPQGLPITDCVDSTDDIGIELDHISTDDQLALYAEFTKVTGLEFASILTSGGASAHAHIKLNRHVDAGAMGYLRRLAVIAFNSDPVIERLHQPMRLPGFYRKEKGRYQELLSLSPERYTWEQIIIGFEKWFAHRGWEMPSDIFQQWWNEIWFPLLSGQNPATPAAKLRSTAQYLAEGQAAYLRRRERESTAKPTQLAQNGSGDDIGEMVRRANDGAGVGDFDGVDWDGHAGHYRGQCPFHQGKTGNSAWLSNHGGAYKFHCCACTNDDPRDLFEYFTARNGLTSIGESNGLKGKDWVEAAKAFLNGLGYTVPERLVGKPERKTVEEFDPAKEFLNTDLPKLKRRVHYEPGKLGEIRDELIDHLKHERDPLTRIYVQGGDEQWLARVLTTGKKVGCCERLNLDKLTQVLDDKFQFYIETKDNEKVVNCPPGVAKHFYNSSRWPGMPYLKGIINLPVLRMDGSVTMQPGYDEESGFLLDFDPKKFDLKSQPTKSDAWEAMGELLDLVHECAFADSRSRSGALSMLLTAVSRSAYPFAPLFAITANTPGAGKGALTEVATLLATGKRYSGMTTFHPEEVEFKKSLIATLQSGSPVVCFDNVDRRHEFGGANLETALTSTEFTGRMLGANANGSFSTQLLFLANGNRMRLTLDMSRRTILMTLDAKEENILEKTYSRDMVSHAAANRGRYVSAALTILQAYLREKPVIDVKLFNGYLEWSFLVRNALLWLGEADPVPSSDDIFSLDGIEEKRHDLYALMDAWYLTKQSIPATAKEIVAAAQSIPALMTALEDVAKDFKAGGKVTPAALGFYLRGNCGIRVGNRRIVKVGDKTKHGIYWQLETL